MFVLFGYFLWLNLQCHFVILFREFLCLFVETNPLKCEGPGFKQSLWFFFCCCCFMSAGERFVSLSLDLCSSVASVGYSQFV